MANNLEYTEETQTIYFVNPKKFSDVMTALIDYLEAVEEPDTPSVPISTLSMAKSSNVKKEKFAYFKDLTEQVIADYKELMGEGESDAQ